MYKNTLVAVLLAWHAIAMDTPELLSGEQLPSSAPLLPTQPVHHQPEPGCWNCFSSHYVDTDQGLLSGCWVRHSDLYQFCLPCLRMGGRSCLGFCGVGLVTILILGGAGVLGWFIYDVTTDSLPTEPPQIPADVANETRVKARQVMTG